MITDFNAFRKRLEAIKESTYTGVRPETLVRELTNCIIDLSRHIEEHHHWQPKLTGDFNATHHQA